MRYRGALTSHANFQLVGPARVQAFHEMIGTGNVATDRFPKHENQRVEYPITCGRAGHRDRSDAAQIGGYCVSRDVGAVTVGKERPL